MCIVDTYVENAAASNEEAGYRVGQVLCQPYWPDGSVQTMAPRYVATKLLEELHGLGFEIKSAAELEFRVFDQNSKPGMHWLYFL